MVNMSFFNARSVKMWSMPNVVCQDSRFSAHFSNSVLSKDLSLKFFCRNFSIHGFFGVFCSLVAKVKEHRFFTVFKGKFGWLVVSVNVNLRVSGMGRLVRHRVLCEEVHKRLSSNSCVGRLLSRGCVLVAIGVCLFHIQVSLH